MHCACTQNGHISTSALKSDVTIVLIDPDFFRRGNFGNSAMGYIAYFSFRMHTFTAALQTYNRCSQGRLGVLKDVGAEQVVKPHLQKLFEFFLSVNEICAFLYITRATAEYSPQTKARATRPVNRHYGPTMTRAGLWSLRALRLERDCGPLVHNFQY